MDKSLIVFDNFYNNVDQAREFALEQEFVAEGNYPGFRSAPENDKQHSYLKNFFESLMNKKITYWPNANNTTYQITTKKSITWIHHDQTMWAAVLYLTPGAPVKSGTAIYRHKPTGVYQWDGIANSPSDFNHSSFLGDSHMNLWEQIHFVGNIYNRLVIYKGNMYHRSVQAGFGTNKYTGRLIQTFFFDT